jgi:hypothetical protein
MFHSTAMAKYLGRGLRPEFVRIANSATYPNTVLLKRPTWLWRFAITMRLD